MPRGGAVYLNVAEKPSVAREIARCLGGANCQGRPGLSQYNQVFEFPFELRGQQVHMIVTSVTGHLMEINFPKETKDWRSFGIDKLFDYPIVKGVTKRHEAVEANLKREAARATHLACWLDCDREGENISFEVIDVCQKVNPRITVLRAHFSSLTPRDLHRAVQNLGTPDDKSAAAVDARQEIDLRIGAVFTRFQTLLLRDRFSGMPEKVSYGPCQFPTLGFVVNRYWEREGFEAEPFWQIKMAHTREEVPVVTTAPEPVEGPPDGGAASPPHATEANANVNTPPPAAGPPDNGPATPPAAVPRSTAGANRVVGQVTTTQFKWARERVFDKQAAGLLYEHCVLTPTVTVRRVVRKQKSKWRPVPLATVQMQKLAATHLRFGSEKTMALAEELYQGTLLSYPRTETDRFNVNAEELRALIAPHQQDPTVGGWMSSTIPNYEEGDTFTPTSLTLEAGATTAPDFLTETDLIATMDRNGIGTDATIAQHIQTVKERGYVKVENMRFRPTQLGLALVQAYDVMGFAALALPKMRASMEADLVGIVRGRENRGAVVIKHVAEYRSIYRRAAEKADILVASVGRWYSSRSGREQVVSTDFSKCGNCDQWTTLVSIQDEAQEFTDYSLRCDTCRLSLPLPRGRPTATQHVCPLCRFQVVEYQGEKGVHHACPYCYSHPPKLSGDIENTLGVMRCFQCSHAPCPLAKARPQLRICPNGRCGEPMELIKKKDGAGFFIGCRGYKNGCKHSVYMPEGIEVAASSDVCTVHPETKKLVVKFKHGVHPPDWSMNCDADFKAVSSSPNRTW
ncbi:DNA topoisomerase 3-alpha [Diplonema papillatum]|nr:DNA topoisomerase 3-alpha [Diplonema papillatum]